MQTFLRHFVKYFIWLPFLLGVGGFVKAGLPLTNAMYASFCLYFASVYSTKLNTLIEIARWTAPVALCTGLLYSFSALWHDARKWFLGLLYDGVIIYSDTADTLAPTMAKVLPHAIAEIYSSAKPGRFDHYITNQIIMFSDDEMSLTYYRAHMKDLDTKNTVIYLHQLDSNVIASNKARCYNLTESCARTFWTSNPLSDIPSFQTVHKAEIVIIGSSELAEKMLCSALTLNVVYPDQQVTYRFFDANEVTRATIGGTSTMNGDRVVWEPLHWYEALDTLHTADRIILADQHNSEQRETILYAAPRVPVFFFSLSPHDIAGFYNSNMLHNFGPRADVISTEWVLGDASYKGARELHSISIGVNPDSREAETEWRALNGFYQGSYLSIAYWMQMVYRVRTAMNDTPELTDEECTLLEHIRWCRFYQLAHWVSGTPENGALRDPVRRIHRSLVPYEELNEFDRRRLFHRVDFLRRSSDGARILHEKKEETPL